ncbi:MAG: hypothetical protein ACQEXJ_06670 [Myxococcota bacterium]
MSRVHPPGWCTLGLILLVGGCLPQSADEADDGTTTTLADECGDVTYDGYCDELGRLVFCNEGRLIRQDCFRQGKVCRPGTGDPGYFCLEPCDGVTLAGACDGNERLRCRAGSLHTRDCNDTADDFGADSTCAWVPERCRYECVGCGDLPEGGRCDGDRYEYCRDGSPSYIDCGAHGSHCGTDPDTGETGCLNDSGTSSCDPGTPDRCEDGLLWWCDGGQLRWYNCRYFGLRCVVDEATGRAGCQGCDVPWWDDRCYDGQRHLCEDDRLVTEPCAETCETPR